MVIPSPSRWHQAGQRGVLTTELLVSIGLIMLAIFPLALGFVKEQRLCRAYYQRALAMEIVDGEIEVLAAGEWRAFAPGPQPYTPRAASVTNLPPGRFQLTVLDRRLRLEWRPAKRGQGGPVLREVTLP
jgi:hypothetical protein